MKLRNGIEAVIPVAGSVALNKLMLMNSILSFRLLSILLMGTVLSSSVEAAARRPNPRYAVIEDFSDMVTSNDLGFDDFSGNFGAINNDPNRTNGVFNLVTSIPAGRLTWDFSGDPNNFSFVGVFFSLFGLTDTRATFDGVTVVPIRFDEHTLNLNQVDGMLAVGTPPRSYDSIKATLQYTGSVPLKVRFELKDAAGRVRYVRRTVKGSRGARTISWNFRRETGAQPDGPIDLTATKVFSVVVERAHAADGVVNPDRGELNILQVTFVASSREVEPRNTAALLDLLERRACQYFFDWTSRKTESLGIPQDRSTFADLLTVGGIGFALPAYVIAAERAWISRYDAASSCLNVLRVLDNPSAFGPERLGRIGYRGWFYHFLGSDGRRKLNFDYPTSEANEALNTVELSSIDTALALMGVLAAQSYFDGASSEEVEIRSRAQSIYDRVDWPFLLEPCSRQFYHGWKPIEVRGGPAFEIGDGAGTGAYSGQPGYPLTWDIYSDETVILTLLGLGATNQSVPATVACAWSRIPKDSSGLIASYSGSLFTYQFLRAFVDTSTLTLPACGEIRPLDLYANSKQAIERVVSFAASNPNYGPKAWGISAAEGADDRYRGFGPAVVADNLNSAPDENGTVTYYAMASAVTFGPDLKSQTVAAIREGWRRGHWHSRFGLPDAFHPEIARLAQRGDLFTEPDSENRLLRTTGPWVQRALFAIDQGPMLLHLENDRSGLIWRLFANNPNMQRAIARISSPQDFFVQSEGGTGGGTTFQRSRASNRETTQLFDSQSRTNTFLASAGTYRLRLRYSNDNFGPLEAVEVSVDGTIIGSVSTEDTTPTGSEPSGSGWNVFYCAEVASPVSLGNGNHSLSLKVMGGDGFGIELDAVEFLRE
jgi:hypothetical protein